MTDTKRRVYEVLEVADDEDHVSRIVDRTILTLIGLSVVVVIAESVETVGREWTPVFWLFEIATVVVFSVEYLPRVWCCTVSARYPTRLSFILSPMGTPIR